MKKQELKKAEKEMVEIITNSKKLKDKEKGSILYTLHHEFGHALGGAKHEGAKFVSIRVNRWFVLPDVKDGYSIHDISDIKVIVNGKMSGYTDLDSNGECIGYIDNNTDDISDEDVHGYIMSMLLGGMEVKPNLESGLNLSLKRRIEIPLNTHTCIYKPSYWLCSKSSDQGLHRRLKRKKGNAVAIEINNLFRSVVDSNYFDEENKVKHIQFHRETIKTLRKAQQL